MMKTKLINIYADILLDENNKPTGLYVNNRMTVGELAGVFEKIFYYDWDLKFSNFDNDDEVREKEYSMRKAFTKALKDNFTFRGLNEALEMPNAFEDGFNPYVVLTLLNYLCFQGIIRDTCPKEIKHKTVHINTLINLENNGYPKGFDYQKEIIDSNNKGYSLDTTDFRKIMKFIYDGNYRDLLEEFQSPGESKFRRDEMKGTIVDTIQDGNTLQYLFDDYSDYLGSIEDWNLCNVLLLVDQLTRSKLIIKE